MYNKNINDDIEPDFRSDVQTVKDKEMEEQEEESKKETYTPIEILNFSPRTLNALINGGIGSIEQLVKCSPSKLGNFRGFGKKAMTNSTVISNFAIREPRSKNAFTMDYIYYKLVLLLLGGRV